MPQLRTPKYRRQKTQHSELAFVELDGIRHYLGKYDSAESHEKYHRLLAEWAAGAKAALTSQKTSSQMTIIELCAHIWEHARYYY